MTAVQALFGGVAVVAVIGVIAIFAGGEPLDTMDKLSSVGALVIAVAAAFGAWKRKPRAHKPASWIWPSRPRREYFTWLIARNRDMDIRGLGTQGPLSLEMEYVYVDVSLVPRPIHQATGDPLAAIGDKAAKRREISSFLTEWPPHTLAIVGPPGGGKTTLLKHLTLLLASGRQRARSLRRRVPILLTIRDLGEAITADAELPLIRAVMSTLPKELARVEPWIEQQLADGKCLVMFDGLDEVADPTQRRLVAAWVERRIAAHHHNGFVVTSRPYGYQSNPLNSADVLQVRPFTDDQIKRFVQRWYAATEMRRTGRKDGVVLSDATSRADDLLRRLRAHPRLYELAVNPLLLTMIAHVHQYRGVLPGGRAELYREICQVFLGGRQAAKGLTSQLTADQRESVLRHLALSMMKARQRDIEAAAAARLIRTQLARVAPGMRPESFMTETEQQSGLLVQRESGVYAFAHLTFQEYLAAERLRERGGAAFLGDRVDDPWWRETTLLYCANADASPVVQACLHEDSARSLLLAADCAEVAREVDPGIRERLDQVLAEARHTTDPTRATLIGQLMLTRKLRRIRHDKPDIVVVDEPVTNVEFDLYLRATRAIPRRWPVQWTRGFVARYPDAPVTGLTNHDKELFCAWAGSVTEWSFERMPSTYPGLLIGVPEQDPEGVLDTGVARALELRHFRSAKAIFLGNVMSASGAVDADGKHVVARLSDSISFVRWAQLTIMDKVLRGEPFEKSAVEGTLPLLDEAELLLRHWKDNRERDIQDLLPLLICICHLAELTPILHSRPQIAVALDQVLTLYWWAAGLVTPQDQFWLRRI